MARIQAAPREIGSCLPRMRPTAAPAMKRERLFEASDHSEYLVWVTRASQLLDGILETQ